MTMLKDDRWLLDGSTETVLLPEFVLGPEGVLEQHAVVVRGERIVEVAPAAAVQPGSRAVVSLPRRLLMPGMIDTHHHLTQSFGKSLVFGEPSEIFRRVWVPMEQFLDEEALYLAAKLGALESLRGGFTTVADAGTRAEVAVTNLARATTEAGLRLVLGYICNNVVDGREIEPLAQVAARADAFLARHASTALVHPSLAVSTPETVRDAVLVHVARRCRALGIPFQTHLNEHLVAVERSLDRLGLRPIEHLAAIGAIGPELLAAHATLATPRELALLREHGAAVAYNPVASAWKGNAVAPALLMHEFGMRFGLGTDGTRADGFRLLDAAETAQRLTVGNEVGDASCGGGWSWIEHALVGGADALHLGATIGRIEAGYAADLLVVDLDVPEMQPLWDLPWSLVRHASRDQIEAVIVAGRTRLWRGWPTDWDGRALVARAAELGRRVVKQSPVRRLHPTSQVYAQRRRAEAAGHLGRGTGGVR
jgi:5-methylthioadenosine/S-adenosylhomocysteine deaminase